MTNAELAILSLLAEKPRHGYAIEKVIEKRGMRDWADISFSSIYYLLKKLDGRGWITGQAEPNAGQGPARTVYRLTAAGKAAWHQAALKRLSTPRRGEKPFQLGLANLPGIPPREALQALRQYRQRLTSQRDDVQSRWSQEQSNGSLPYHVHALFDLSLNRLDAQLDWVAGFIRKLEVQMGDWGEST
jgi:DNA-binding PadR family transcriptional regulator